MTPHTPTSPQLLLALGQEARDSPPLRYGCAASSGAADGPVRLWVDCSEVGAGGR